MEKIKNNHFQFLSSLNPNCEAAKAGLERLEKIMKGIDPDEGEGEIEGEGEEYDEEQEQLEVFVFSFFFKYLKKLFLRFFFKKTKIRRKKFKKNF